MRDIKIFFILLLKIAHRKGLMGIKYRNHNKLIIREYRYPNLKIKSCEIHPSNEIKQKRLY